MIGRVEAWPYTESEWGPPDPPAETKAVAWETVSGTNIPTVGKRDLFMTHMFAKFWVVFEGPWKPQTLPMTGVAVAVATGAQLANGASRPTSRVKPSMFMMPVRTTFGQRGRLDSPVCPFRPQWQLVTHKL